MGERTAKTRIGAMRMRFVIETPVETPNALGGASISWQAGAAFWGRLEAKKGSEPVVGERVSAKVLARIITRHRAGLTAGMRLRCGARLFEIVAVFDPDGRREFLNIEAEEAVA
jgi:SPP1 family predicted phage head-tail adaptor